MLFPRNGSELRLPCLYALRCARGSAAAPWRAPPARGLAAALVASMREVRAVVSSTAPELRLPCPDASTAPWSLHRAANALHGSEVCGAPWCRCRLRWGCCRVAGALRCAQGSRRARLPLRCAGGAAGAPPRSPVPAPSSFGRRKGPAPSPSGTSCSRLRSKQGSKARRASSRRPTRPEGSVTYPMGFQHLTRPGGLTWLSATLCNRQVWALTRSARPERCCNG